MDRRIAAVVNPYAAGGRAGRLWPALDGRLRERLGEVAVRFTTYSGHAARIAQDLITDGYDLIIAVGGDGTTSEVANGFLRNDCPINPEAQLGILPAGTGADFPRSLAISSNTDEAINVLAGGRVMPIDVAKVRYTGSDGRERQRHFLNLMSFGISGAIAVRAKGGLQALGGKAAFLWATLRTAATDRGRAVEIRVDNDDRWRPLFITNVAVGNGRFHGSGMHACPRAVLDDGLLDVTIIDYLDPLEIVRDIRVLYSENVYAHPKTHHLRVRRLAARSTEPTWIEVDGEPLGRLPIEIEVLPQRLRILCPPSTLLNGEGPAVSDRQSPGPVSNVDG